MDDYEFLGTPVVTSIRRGSRRGGKTMPRDGERSVEGSDLEVPATENAGEAWGIDDSGERKKQ